MTNTTASVAGTSLTTNQLSPMQQIEYYIANPPNTSVVLTITPTLAVEIINKYNVSNRSPKPVKISEYIVDMKINEWMLTGDTIKFSDVRLLDGQNRLMACIKSKTPFITHVVFGINDDVFDRIDRGRNRNGPDILHMAGFTNSVNLSAAINWVYRLKSGNTKGRGVLLPHDQLEKVQNEWSTLPNFMAQGSRIYKNTKYPAGMCAAFIYVFDEINPKAATLFANAWESGDYTKVPSLMSFNTKMLKTKTQLGTVHDTSRAAFTVIAWNLFRAHRTGRQQDFSWLAADKFPMISIK